MKPQIVDKIVHPDGSEESVQPQEVRRVISESAAAQLSQMLRSVVTNGHGKQADVPGYLVAGKTGTAQVASADSRGYAQGINIGSFAGFAPMNDPRFVVLVRVNNPRSVDWAESSAAPTVGELMRFLLDYYNIEPTEQYTQAVLDHFNATHNLSSYFMGNPTDNANAGGNSNINKTNVIIDKKKN
jgi:cell division protein FtsI/penicillin-binding protein 2